MSRWSDTVDAELNALYDQVPDVGCKGLCADVCGPIDMNPRERVRIRQAGVRIPGPEESIQLLIDSEGEWSCPALVDGRCSVYRVRPMICRVWGASEDLRCPYGCLPIDGNLLTQAQTRALLNGSAAAGTLQPPE